MVGGPESLRDASNRGAMMKKLLILVVSHVAALGDDPVGTFVPDSDHETNVVVTY